MLSSGSLRQILCLRSLAAAAVLCGLCGCVRTKVLVTSDPPGADVTMNSVHLGRTPVEQPFAWFWYYDFLAEKEGFEPAVSRERFRAPLYLVPPMDLVMEMMPFPVTHTRRVHLALEERDVRPDPEMALSDEAESRGELPPSPTAAYPAIPSAIPAPETDGPQ
ncbi:MAG: PEGA domain-containing protein [Sumerlaeia bacterium]